MNMNVLSLCCFALMAAVALLLGFPGEALANGTSVLVGGNPIDTNFTCNNGAPQGSLLQVSSCPNAPDFAEGTVFSYFICQFEQLLNETLSEVYCAVLLETTPAVMATLTLMVTLAGVGFLTGMLPFTAKELAMIGAKFSLVLAFATQAEFMIGIGYNLFVNMAKEGIVLTFDTLFTLAMANGLGSNLGVTQLDTVDDVYQLFDKTLANIIAMASEGEGNNNQCQDAVFTMLVAIAAVIPPLAFVGIYFIFKLLWMMLRAIFGYCQGLLGLTFLVVLSPIYISFALFKPTRSLFDKWVKYLVTFAFQMVIVFAFLGMVFFILSQVADDTKAYTDLVKPYKQDTMSAPSVFNFADTCGVCKLKPTDNVKDKPECDGSGEVLPLTEMSKDENFMEFMMVKVLAMLVLFYILDIMLDFVPEMARHLAGPKYAGQLGGGRNQGQIALPGEQGIGTALGSGSRAFLGSSNSITGGINAARAAVAQGVIGEGGMVDVAIRSVANPQDPTRRLGGNDEVDLSRTGNLFGTAALLTGGAAILQQMRGAYNASLSDTISQAMANLGDNPSREQIEAALGTVAGTADEIRAAILAMDLGSLPPDVADYLRQYANG